MTAPTIPGVYHITPGLTQKSEAEKRQYAAQLELNRKYIDKRKKELGI